MTVLGAEMLAIAIVDEGVEIGRRLDDDVAALAAITAVGSAERDEFLAAERDGARAPVAALQIDLGFVEKLQSAASGADACGAIET
jgi:hypothetical protein